MLKSMKKLGTLFAVLKRRYTESRMDLRKVVQDADKFRADNLPTLKKLVAEVRGGAVSDLSPFYEMRRQTKRVYRVTMARIRKPNGEQYKKSLPAMRDNISQSNAIIKKLERQNLLNKQSLRAKWN